MFKGLSTTAAICLLLLSMAAHAAPVFFDDFDIEPGSGAGATPLSAINYNGFANWTVTEGTVDLVADGDFGPIDCLGNAGKCIDLDGTSSDAGVMSSSVIALDPGRYRLSLWLAGVSNNFQQSGAAAQPNDVNVTVSGFVDVDMTFNQGDPFVEVAAIFDVASVTAVSIVISHAGGDNFGAVLDNVSVSVVPLPAGGWLLASALLGFGLRIRR